MKTPLITQSEPGCCDDGSYQIRTEGCVGGQVTYKVVTVRPDSTTTTRWINTITGQIHTAEPAGFVARSCGVTSGTNDPAVVQAESAFCDDCCHQFQTEGCVDGQPMYQISVVRHDGTATTRWVNGVTGQVFSTQPAGFVVGSCSASAGIAWEELIDGPTSTPAEIDEAVSAVNSDTFLPRAGGTMTGALVIDEGLGMFQFKVDPVTGELTMVNDLGQTASFTPSALSMSDGTDRTVIDAGGSVSVFAGSGSDPKLPTLPAQLTPKAYVDAATAPTWTDYATRWDAQPAQVGSTVAGAVYAYELDGVTRYRLVPSPYAAADDAFYAAWDGADVSDLIVSRG